MRLAAILACLSAAAITPTASENPEKESKVHDKRGIFDTGFGSGYDSYDVQLQNGYGDNRAKESDGGYQVTEEVDEGDGHIGSGARGGAGSGRGVGSGGSPGSGAANSNAGDNGGHFGDGQNFQENLGYGGEDETPHKVVTITKQVPVPVPQIYPVEVVKPIPIKVPHPIPYTVDKPYPVQVEKPYHVTVEKLVPYTVEKKVPYPVYVTEKVPVPHPIKVYVPKPVPYKVRVPVKVPVPHPVIIYKKFPVYVHSSSNGGRRHVHRGGYRRSYPDGNGIYRYGGRIRIRHF